MTSYMSWNNSTTNNQDPTLQGYQDYTKRMQGYGTNLNRGVMAGSPLAPNGQMRPQYMGSASSPGFQNTMANLNYGMGDAARGAAQTAANMAIGNRGRNFVRGGINPYAAQAQGVTQGLASMYGQNYQTALNNEWRGADQALKGWQAQAGLGSDYFNKELMGRRAGSDWEWKMWQDNLDKERLDWEKEKYNREWGRSGEDRDRAWQQEQWRRAQQERSADEARWERERTGNTEDYKKQLAAMVDIPGLNADDKMRWYYNAKARGGY